VKISVLPLKKKKTEIVARAHELRARLSRRWVSVYDDTAAIGRLYRRQDEVGTPYCLTVDHQSLEDNHVTIRDRDTMEQQRVPIAEIQQHLSERLGIAVMSYNKMKGDCE
jgi:glycyl-tRNA synthetase